MQYRQRIDSPYKEHLELAVCANDPLHWFRWWAWTYDPRVDPSLRPFDLFPRQEEYITWLQARERGQENGLVEKSRDSGLTFLCCGYALHGWLFRAGFSAGFGSRKLELVDRIGDPDSIFQKLRLMVDNLPAWMRPAGYMPGKHDGFCKLLNPANGSTVTGEGGDEIGRGGRKTIYFVDESAFLEHPQRVDSALSQTTRVRIDVSTPNGPGNPFYRRRFGGNVSVFTFHWRDDPRKGEEWYRAESLRIADPVVMAQEVDIDYTASIEGITIPAAWVRAAVDFPLTVYAAYPLTAGFDVADGGGAKSVLISRRGPVVLDPAGWGELSAGRAAWRAADEAERLGVEAVNYDCIGVGTSVKEAWENSDRKPRFQANAIKWGAPPSRMRWPSGKTSEETFANMRTELWWIMRTRFERTYQVREEGAQFPTDELISIPNHPDLIADLSLPLSHHTATGKIQLESKADMRKRGVKSPDYGDALAYTFAPVRSVTGGWRGRTGGYV